MTVVDLLDRPIYPYAEADRLIGLKTGTARRWINGYRRGAKVYRPTLREQPTDTEWATWREFVEARMLAEYRELNIPTARLRETIAALRNLFGVPHPLAFPGPNLEAESGELTPRLQQLDARSGDERMVVRTGQILLGEPSRNVVGRATLARDDQGRAFVSQLVPDHEFPRIVINPDHPSRGRGAPGGHP